ncbi:UNVERIFIED_ORG: transcriptional regulator [Clostridium botulinum]
MLGKKIKFLRNEQGITQDQLADYINVSRQSVWGYENNSVEPSLNVLVKIADVFNVSLDYLLCRTSEKYNLNLENQTNKELLLKIYDILNSYKIEKK